MSEQGIFCRRAFTLIELLVVISIIALLIALLLPVLGKAKAASRISRDLSNLKGMTFAMSAFAYENDGALMEIDDSPTGAYWYNDLESFIDKLGFAQNNGDTSDASIGLCPETTVPNDFNVGTSIGYRAGSATSAWIYYSESGSYGINCWLQPKGNIYNSGLYASFPKSQFYDKLEECEVSSDTPMFSDAAWVGAWARPINLPMANLTTPSIGPIGITRYITNRHGRVTNTSFVDGHVETLALQEMWNLNWYRGWVDPAPVTIP